MKRVVGVVVWVALLVGVMLWPAVTYDWSIGGHDVRRDHDPHVPRRLHHRRRRRPARGRDADRRLPGLRQARHLPVLRRGRPERHERPPGAARHLGDARRLARAVRDPGREPGPDHQRPHRLRGRDDRPRRAHLRHRLHDRRRPRGGDDRPAARSSTGTSSPAAGSRRSTPPTSPSTCPSPASGVQCARGVGQSGGCSAEGDGTQTLTVDVESLSPNTPVTVKVGLDMATPETGTSVPWSARLRPGARPQPVPTSRSCSCSRCSPARTARGRRARSARRPRRTRCSTARRTASDRRRARTS